MGTKTEMTMIHAVVCSTNTAISLQRMIPCKGEDRKGRGNKREKERGRETDRVLGKGLEEKGCLLRVVGIIEAHR